MRLGLALVLGFLCSGAFAKNLDNRLGFGVSYQNFNQSPALSLKFFHDNFIATNFLFGFNTEDNSYLIGAKSLRNVVMEENMNLFVGIAGYILSNRTTSLDTGLEFDALLGGEFFLAGLPNLGVGFETGFGLRSLRTTNFRTVGGAFASGSVHYYF
jgi:hypothetical protein